jgi:hypothetical protein
MQSQQNTRADLWKRRAVLGYRPASSGGISFEKWHRGKCYKPSHEYVWQRSRSVFTDFDGTAGLFMGPLLISACSDRSAKQRTDRRSTARGGAFAAVGSERNGRLIRAVKL